MADIEWLKSNVRNDDLSRDGSAANENLAKVNHATSTGNFDLRSISLYHLDEQFGLINNSGKSNIKQTFVGVVCDKAEVA